MNFSEVYKSWNRWLDGRSIDDRLLGDVMSTDPEILERLVEDLELHRQLTAIGEVDRQDPDFVSVALKGFDKAHSGAQSTRANGSRTTLGWVASATVPDSCFAGASRFRDELVNPVRGHDVEAPDLNLLADEERPSRRKGIHRRRPIMASLVLGIPLFAGLLVVSFQAGRQSALNDPAGDSTSTPPSLVERSADTTDPPPVLQKGDPESDRDSNLVGQPDDRNLPDDANRREVPVEDFFDRFPNARRLQGVDSEPPENDIANNRSIPHRKAVFASVREAVPCEWAVDPPQSARIGARLLELKSGCAVIDFDNGSQLTVTGPSRLEVLDNELVSVVSGKYSLQVPQAIKEPWVMDSAGARLQLAGDSRITYDVEPNGNSSLKLEQGSVDVFPWYGQMARNSSMPLSPDGFDKLEFEGLQPTIARFGNDKGEYEGWVNLNGRILKSRNRRFVEDAFATAQRRAEQAPGLVDQEWRSLLALLREDVLGQPENGEIPGMPPGVRVMPPVEVEEVMDRIRNLLQEQFQDMQFDMNGFGNGFLDNGFFGNGGMNRNGMGGIQNQSKEKLDALRKEILGSFADLFDERDQ